jgi:hypothetical protein
MMAIQNCYDVMMIMHSSSCDRTYLIFLQADYNPGRHREMVEVESSSSDSVVADSVFHRHHCGLLAVPQLLYYCMLNWMEPSSWYGMYDKVLMLYFLRRISFSSSVLEKEEVIKQKELVYC